MSYIEKSLSAGEKIESVFKFHWFVWIPVFIWTCFVITIPIALYGLLQILFTEQGLTNKRVLLKTGIIGRKTEEMKLKAIETVEIDQSVFGRIFGYGNVKITGRGSSSVLFKFVGDPMGMKRQIESISDPLE